MNYLIVENRPEGFFSNFNLIIGSLNYLYDSKIDNFYFHWNNPLYQENSENLFDKYFFKQNIEEKLKKKSADSNEIVFDKIYTTVDLGVHLFNFITPIEVYRKMNSILRFHNYFDNEIYKSCNVASAKKEKSLGVHVRGTDHSRHGKLLTLEYYFSKIDERLNNHYDNLFLATDENKIVNAFKHRYGDRVFTNQEIKRSDTMQSIHYSNFPSKEKLVIDVMTDAASLANCDEIIITASNVSGYVLMVNPDIKYQQIDTHVEFIH